MRIVVELKKDALPQKRLNAVYKYTDLQKTFHLTEGERYLLLESNVGEGLFFAGQKHAAIKIIASYTEDQIITSDPQQLLEIRESKKQFEKASKEAKA